MALASPPLGAVVQLDIAMVGLGARFLFSGAANIPVVLVILLFSLRVTVAPGDVAGTGPYGVVPAGYDKDVPPKQLGDDGSPQRTLVLFGVVMKKLLDVKPERGVIQFCAWVRRYWYDARLNFSGQALVGNREQGDRPGVLTEPWDSSGRSHLALPMDLIWQPDIHLNEAVEDFVENYAQTGLMLFDDVFAATYGYNVMWSTAYTITAKCKLSLRMFPFDVNVCQLLWQPWSELYYELVPIPEVIKLDLITELYEVNFINPAGERYAFVKPLPGGLDSGEYVGVKFELRIGRFPRYYVVNYILPIILVVFLGYITFFIPLDKSDRLAYACTLLLTALAVQFITADKRPAERVSMWLDKFQMFSILLITVPILQTVVLFRIIMYANRSSEEARRMKNKLVRGIDRVFRVCYPIFLAVVLLWLFAPVLTSATFTEIHETFGFWTIVPPPLVTFLGFFFPVFVCFCGLACINMYRRCAWASPSATREALIDAIAGDETDWMTEPLKDEEDSDEESTRSDSSRSSRSLSLQDGYRPR